MSDYKFTLPWPPSVNGYWRTFRNRQIISKRGREYRISAKSRMEQLGLSGERVSEQLSVSVKLYPPTLRRYDIDNFTKAVFDALTLSGFWVDDEQVVKLTVEKQPKLKCGKVELSITKL